MKKWIVFVIIPLLALVLAGFVAGDDLVYRPFSTIWWRLAFLVRDVFIGWGLDAFGWFLCVVILGVIWLTTIGFVVWMVRKVKKIAGVKPKKQTGEK